MALTADDIAAVCNRNGIDSPEAFEQLIRSAGASVAVIQMDAEIKKEQEALRTLTQAAQDRIDALTLEKQRLERLRDGLE